MNYTLYSFGPIKSYNFMYAVNCYAQILKLLQFQQISIKTIEWNGNTFGIRIETIDREWREVSAGYIINFQKRHILSTIYMYDIGIEHYFSFEPNVSELVTLQLILRCLLKSTIWTTRSNECDRLLATGILTIFMYSRLSANIE